MDTILKRILAFSTLVMIGLVTWWLGHRLTADAIAMGIGFLFGAMASIPTALIIVAKKDRGADQCQWGSDEDQLRVIEPSSTSALAKRSSWVMKGEWE